MIIAVTGAFWVLSVLIALILLVIVFDTLKENKTRQVTVREAWDTPRRIVSIWLALAAFYIGFARNVSLLPPLIAYQLSLAPAPLWPAETWRMIAMGCLTLALIFSLFDLQWAIRLPRFSLARLADWQWSDLLRALRELLYPEQPDPMAIPQTIRRNQQLVGGQIIIRRQVAIAGLIFAAAIFGLFLLSRSGIPGTLVRVTANYAFGTLFPTERIRPTPTAVSNELAVAANGVFDSTTSASTPVAFNAEQATNSNGTQLVSTESQQSIQEDGNLRAATLPPAATSTPTPTDIALVLINNPAGVNARAAPDLSAEVRTVLLPGSSVPVLEETLRGDWIHVQLSGGSDAWVANYVVDLSRPLGGTGQAVTNAPPNLANEAVAVASQPEPQQTPVVPTPQPTVAPVAQQDTSGQSTAIQAASAQTVRTSAINSSNRDTLRISAASSDLIQLLEPEPSANGQNEVTLRWGSEIALGAIQGYEVVVWLPNQSPLVDGASLGPPITATELTIDLGQRGLSPGEYIVGILLVQTQPYRRLAHLSNIQFIEIR
ncbi:SH3 domain-containing protein [Chloroflexi bacterium TSY]|nr:SH3 domain-containing protein [Chloroflexi bacterium TSY]